REIYGSNATRARAHRSEKQTTRGRSVRPPSTLPATNVAEGLVAPPSPRSNAPIIATACVRLKSGARRLEASFNGQSWKLWLSGCAQGQGSTLGAGACESFATLSLEQVHSRSRLP